MTLIEEAVRADQISDAFSNYRDPNPEHVQSINAAIAELAGLSWALREIYKLLEENGHNLYLVEEDLKLVHDSVYFTLADIWHIIGTINKRTNSPVKPEDFRRNWRRIVRYCRERGGQELSTRLEKYKRLLHGLCQTLKSPNPEPNRDDMGLLRREVHEIAAPVDRKLLGGTEQLPAANNGELTNPAAYGLQTRRSYERHRDIAPMSPSESGESSSAFGLPIHHVPSPPVTPASPTHTFSTTSHVSSVEQETPHWAFQVFKDIPSWTPLPTSTKASEYHDVTGHPKCDHPSDSYDEVVALSFPPDPPVRVGLFCRPRDWRSKVVVRWRDHRGRETFACIPLNMLKVFRAGPMLHLCRRLPDGRSALLWLSMKFTTVERLVLFACTFLSMRAHDGKKPVKPVDDWQLEGEEEEYAGKIRDNGFSHALRIYRDKVSTAIRLQASVLGGQLDCTPVWTAFITHSVVSRTWCETLDRNVVCLRELRPYNFSSDYEFPRMPNGAFMLTFETKDDASDFVARIDDLGRKYRKARK